MLARSRRGGALLVAALAAAGCGRDLRGPSAERADEHPVARRIVSLVPAVTEILSVLGAAERLVARTDADDDPGLAHLPSVGPVLTPNFEVLAAVEPDLVIGWSGSDVSGLSRAVERAGARVETLSIDGLAALEIAISRVGGWIGRTGAADRLRREIDATLERARGLAAAGEAPRVLWVVWSDPIIVAGKGTFLDDVIEAAGGRNAMTRGEPSWARLGLESLIRLNPDVLIWPDGPGMFSPQDLGTRTGWSLLAAVRRGRVLAVESDRFHVPGPGIAHATFELAKRLRGVDDR